MMSMKIMLAFVFAATIVLLAGPPEVLNAGNGNSSVCCTAAKKCTESQIKPADNTEFERDPFNILIPGNHF